MNFDKIQYFDCKWCYIHYLPLSLPIKIGNVTIKSYILFATSLILCITSAYGQSCDVNGRKHYSFQDVKLILDKNNCNNCHQSPSQSTSWTYHTYEEMNSTSNCNDIIIVPGFPNRSLLIDKLNGGPTACGNAMPLGTQKISNSDLIALESWIGTGAPEYCLSEYEQIKDILVQNKCVSCHQTNNQWSFETYNALFAKPTQSVCDGPEIIKYDAKNSLLYQKISGNATCGLNMPIEGDAMSTQDVAKIRDWINAGAPESSRALPVSLSDFNTYVERDEDIVLQWATSSELNTSHFEIQHSRDGMHFARVGDIDAIGNQQAEKKYRFQFSNANIGYHYFRLKIIDFDDKFSYSPIRVERIDNTSEVLNIMPNPIFKHNELKVEWYPTDDREKVKLLLLSINGQLKHEYILNNGLNTLQLMDVLSGVYYISIEDYYTTRKIKKLIILE